MPIVAEVTISRKFSVGLTMPVLYKNNSDASVPKVSPTACMTMPGYCASNTAEIAPKISPRLSHITAPLCLNIVF